jgi:hypothetical protein
LAALVVAMTGLELVTTEADGTYTEVAGMVALE